MAVIARPLTGRPVFQSVNERSRSSGILGPPFVGGDDQPSSGLQAAPAMLLCRVSNSCRISAPGFAGLNK
jgi:hypothetical protein